MPPSDTPQNDTVRAPSLSISAITSSPSRRRCTGLAVQAMRRGRDGRRAAERGALQADVARPTWLGWCECAAQSPASACRDRPSPCTRAPRSCVRDHEARGRCGHSGFKDHGQTLADADADRGETKPAATASQLMGEGTDDACSGASDRMADRDRSARSGSPSRGRAPATRAGRPATAPRTPR